MGTKYNGQNGLYSIDSVKKYLADCLQMGVKPEVVIGFEDTGDCCRIIGHFRIFSLQRCRYFTLGDIAERAFALDMDELFSSELLDGICLERDWHKVRFISCTPDFDAVPLYAAIHKGRRNKYKIYQVVKQEIDRWDPLGLLRDDAPEDEYDGESEAVTDLIAADMDADTLAFILQRVFDAAFEMPECYPKEACKKVALQICKEIAKID